MAGEKIKHLVHELETQFHSIQEKIGKARTQYLARHVKDFDTAKKQVDQLKAKVKKAKVKYAKAAIAAKKNSSKAAQNQWKKTKAAASLMSQSLQEAKEIMKTQEDKLKAAKPFDRKLAAREKALQAFEKEWEKKIKKEQEQKAKRAKSRAEQKKTKNKTAAKQTTAKTSTPDAAASAPASVPSAAQPVPGVTKQMDDQQQS